MNRGYENRGHGRDSGRWESGEDYRGQEWGREHVTQRGGEPGYENASFGEHGRGGRSDEGSSGDFESRGRQGYSGTGFEGGYGQQSGSGYGQQRGGGGGYGQRGNYGQQAGGSFGGWNEGPEFRPYGQNQPGTQPGSQGYGYGPGGYDFATPGSWRPSGQRSGSGYEQSGSNFGGYSGGGYGGYGGFGQSYSGQQGGSGNYGQQGGYGRDSVTQSFGSGSGSGFGQTGYAPTGYRSSGYPESQGMSTEGWFQGGTRTGRHAGRGPQGYRRSDERIREDVSDQLTEHGEIDASEITVNVSNGEVTLSGTVESRRMKHLAENLADSVTGVREVNNQIRVNRETSSSKSTEEANGKQQSSAQRSKPSMATARA